MLRSLLIYTFFKMLQRTEVVVLCNFIHTVFHCVIYCRIVYIHFHFFGCISGIGYSLQNRLPGLDFLCVALGAFLRYVVEFEYTLLNKEVQFRTHFIVAGIDIKSAVVGWVNVVVTQRI